MWQMNVEYNKRLPISCWTCCNFCWRLFIIVLWCRIIYFRLMFDLLWHTLDIFLIFCCVCVFSCCSTCAGNSCKISSYKWMWAEAGSRGCRVRTCSFLSIQSTGEWSSKQIWLSHVKYCSHVMGNTQYSCLIVADLCSSQQLSLFYFTDVVTACLFAGMSVRETYRTVLCTALCTHSHSVPSRPPLALSTTGVCLCV